MADTPPTETPRDVFAALLDAYRYRGRAWVRLARNQNVVVPTHAHIDAECEKWRQRYQAAVARRLAAAPGE